MSRIVVLLPPSEGKAAGGDGPLFDPGSGAFSELGSARRKVAKALRRRDFDAAAELGVGGVTLVAAIAANRTIARASTMPALHRYTGVLYDALGYAGLPAAARRRLDRDVVIVSGLLGAVAGGDPVPPYKLPIGARVPELGRLVAFWKPRLAPVLTRHLADAVVWDLLPGAHASAVPTALGRTRWKVAVFRERAGRRTSVSHDNKSVKGALARTLIAEQVEDPHALVGWEGPAGYRIDGVRDGTLELVTRD
jgi:cytoplasmic iron level regulating protein YaaA (DUF328/UPF0246 family)